MRADLQQILADFAANSVGHPPRPAQQELTVWDHDQLAMRILEAERFLQLKQSRIAAG